MRTIHKRNSKNIDSAKLIIGFLLTIFALLVFYPFYNSIIISFVSKKYYLEHPFILFPKEINLDSYRIILSDGKLLSGYKITLFTVFFGTIYNMILTVFVSYALIKSFPGKKVIMILIIITMYFGGGLIPTYLLIRNLGLINNLLVYIIPSGFSVFNMFVIRTYFQNIPKELEESAKIDGANELVILFKIILPVSLPVLATFTLFYAVGHWNQYFVGMLYIRDVEKRPLQLVLRSIIMGAEMINDKNMPASIRENVFSESVKMAAVIVVMAPIMFLYPFLQKYFMKGIMIGAIK